MFRTLIGAVFGLVVLGAAATAATQEAPPRSRIAALLPGHWLELTGNAAGTIANTYLARVYPPRQGHPGWGSNGARSVMSAWSGGAYDTKRDRLVVLGGGHSDYGGNEVYVFDLKSQEWRRLTDPSRMDSRYQTLDGTPTSRHTYDGLEYLPRLDRLLLYGGSEFGDGAAIDTAVWLFDFDRLEWERRPGAPAAHFPIAAHDPRTGRYFVHRQYSFNEYDPRSDRWRERSRDPKYLRDSTGEIDPETNRLIIINPKGLFFYDLNTLVPLVRIRAPTTGDRGIERQETAAGLAYDPHNRVIVAWAGNREVWTLDTKTFVWRRHDNPAGPAPMNWDARRKGRLSHGIYGRWRYIPSRNLFIGVNSTTTNVWLYRMPRFGG